MRMKAIKDLVQLPDPKLFAELARGMELCLEHATEVWRSASLLAQQKEWRCTPIDSRCSEAAHDASSELALSCFCPASLSRVGRIRQVRQFRQFRQVNQCCPFLGRTGKAAERKTDRW